MQVFLAHIGKRRRSISELVDTLPSDAPEQTFFREDRRLRESFPNGQFNCWGVPLLAAKAFRKTSIGDLILIVPRIGVRGGIHQIGLVSAKCPVEARSASSVLWPNTPYGRAYPWLFFFHSELGHLGWYDFLEDTGYAANWNPRGWYLRIRQERFRKWGGSEGYLRHLRNECGFAVVNDPV